MLLDYVSYTNVVGANDFFDKLRLWAVSKGWTQEEWRVGQMWSSSSHWVSDARGRFLILSKSGYGTQNLIASFATASRVDYPCFGIMGCMRSQVAYNDTSVQTHPVQQNSICGGVHNMSAASIYTFDGQQTGMELTYDSIIPKVWFFAGPHWIAAFAKMNDVFCQWMHFGACEIFDANPSQGQCFGMYTRTHNYTGLNYKYPWEWWNYKYVGSTNFQSPACISYSAVYVESRGCGFDMYYAGRNFYPWSTQAVCARTNCHINSAYQVSTYTPLLDLSTACKANHFSAKRPLIKPIFSYQRLADSVYVPIARAPFWITASAGLEIGEQLDLDGASYLVFPEPTIYNAQGIALRIA